MPHKAIIAMGVPQRIWYLVQDLHFALAIYSAVSTADGIPSMLSLALCAVAPSTDAALQLAQQCQRMYLFLLHWQKLESGLCSWHSMKHCRHLLTRMFLFRSQTA